MEPTQPSTPGQPVPSSTPDPVDQTSEPKSTFETPPTNMSEGDTDPASEAETLRDVDSQPVQSGDVVDFAKNTTEPTLPAAPVASTEAKSKTRLYLYIALGVSVLLLAGLFIYVTFLS